MASKELTARVKLDTSQAESKLEKLSNLINSINRATSRGSASKSIEKELNDRLKLERQWLAAMDKHYAKQEAAADRVIQKEMNALHRKQAAQNNAFLKEQAQYEASLQKAEQLKQKELEKERIRQQSLNTLGQGDIAAKKMAEAAEKAARAEKEAMYNAMFVKLEWQQAHPILTKLANGWDQINQKIQGSLSKHPRLLSGYNNIVNKVKSWFTSQKQVNDETQKQNSILSGVNSKLKSIAKTYLGIMGAKAVVQTADIITGAENKMNYLNANQLDDKGFNADGTYSQATFDATQKSMDKMFASTQKVRMGYSDMMANVSKSMTLAGGAFKDNTDNAIRFQEIMSEAYILGGASAQEMSTSMYQMIQALGAGTLAGDELRSVREGAPLAYKAIEEFAQGVYNTEESLKDLASQGKITSDMVVAAVMDAGNKMDKAFNNTTMTFDQAWTKIKNAGTKAFEPVLQKLTELLNVIADSGAFDILANALIMVGDALMWVINLFSSFFSWCANNWYWLQYVVIGVLAALIAYALVYTAVHVAAALVRAAAWIKEHAIMLGIYAVIGLLIAGIIWLANTTSDGCQFMVRALLMVAFALVLIGLITGNITMLIVGAIIAIVAIFIYAAQEIIGTVYWVGALIWNILMGIANFIAAVINFIAALVYNVFAFIVNLAVGLWNSIKAITHNIGAAFENCWIWASNTFWTFVENVLSGMKVLEPVINAIASLLGSSFTVSGAIGYAQSKQQDYKSFQDVGGAFNSGWKTKEFKDMGSAWNKGLNAFDYKDLSEAYNAGASVGANIQNKVGEWGSSIQSAINPDYLLNMFSKDGKFTSDELSQLEAAGYDISDPAKLLDDANKGNKLMNPSGGLSPDKFDAIGKDTGNIADNTGSMADSMELTEEDLDYLRKLADLEWKKEYTTAHIQIDMGNNVTINGEADWDGWVTRLSNQLYEELDAVANGVYSY